MDEDRENAVLAVGLDRTRREDVVAEEDATFKETVAALVIDSMRRPSAVLDAADHEVRRTTTVLGRGERKIGRHLRVGRKDRNVGRGFLDDLERDVLWRDARDLHLHDDRCGTLCHAEQRLELLVLLVLDLDDALGLFAVLLKLLLERLAPRICNPSPRSGVVFCLASRTFDVLERRVAPLGLLLLPVVDLPALLAGLLFGKDVLGRVPLSSRANVSIVSCLAASGPKVRQD